MLLYIVGMKPKVLRVAAVIASASLVAVYVGCRASRSAQKEPDKPAVFSGSKSEVLPIDVPQHFGGSKSARVFEPDPPAADRPIPPSQQANPK